MIRAARGAVIALLPLLACGDTSDRASAPPDTVARPDGAFVTLHFSRGEEDVAVRRAVATRQPGVELALRELLRGPSADERAAGIRSWFSQETADHLRSVALAADGTATIDFRDLRPVMPNASSSAGSTQLLRELERTIFEFPEVRSIEYRMDGSCALFWEWLQYGCQRVERVAD